MSRLRLIADDLTGALDTAAQFTGALGSLRVLTSPDVPHPEGSFVVNLSCRDGTADEAIALARTHSDAFQGAEIAFKKIDSLLRGHWTGELAATLEAGAFDRVILAPAFPAQGRFTIDGRQVVRREDGTLDPVAMPRAALAAFGYGDGATQPSKAGLPEILVPDATSDADLAALVARFAHMPRTLWCGAAGLAQALAGVPALKVLPGTSSHLVLVGSHHPSTYRQIERFTAETGQEAVRFGVDGAAAAEQIAARLASHGVCVALPDLPEGLSPSEAAARIDGALAGLLHTVSRPQRFTIVGGETFAALCRHLGALMLTVEGECEPGIPASRIAAGAWAGALCFSKSGAFGDADWLLRQTAAARRA